MPPRLDHGSAMTLGERRDFSVLVATVILKSVAPGAINYVLVPHATPGAPLSAIWTRAAAWTSVGLSVLVAMTAFYVFFRHRAGRSRIGVAGLALIFLALYWYFRDLAIGPSDWRGILDLLTFLGVMLAVSAVRPTPDSLRSVGVAAIAVAGFAMLLLLISRDHAVLPDAVGQVRGASKAIVGGVLLAGPLSHSNTLGIFLAFAYPFIGLIETARRRRVGLAVVLIALILTASRTSIIAVGCAIVYELFSRRVPTRAARVAGYGIGATLGALVVLVPLVATDPAAFSTRGAVWQGSLRAWRAHGSFLFGVGPFWNESGIGRFLAQSGADRSSGHNLAIQWAVTGGALQLAVGAILIGILVRRAVSFDNELPRPIGTQFVICFLVTSIAEFVLVPNAGSQVFIGYLVIATYVLGRPLLAGETGGGPGAKSVAKARRDG